MEYVTIDLSKKQVDFEHPYTNEKNGKEYVRCLAPDNAIFFYPKDSLKENEQDAGRVYFMRPMGTEITLRYSERVQGVPDTAPNEEKYRNTEKVVRIEELYDMYKAAREEFRAKRQEHDSQYIRMSVPEEWGKHFTGKNGVEYVSISLPIREQEGGANYYNFIVAAEHFRVNDQGMGGFSFPIKQKDNPEADYMVSLRREVRLEDGSYERVSKEVSSTALSEEVERAKRASETIHITISDKLVRNFSAKDGTELCSVSVPVLADTQNAAEKEAVFYQIVVPAWRVKQEDNGYGTQRTVLVLPDSADFTFNATRGIKNEATGQYDEDEIKLSAQEVAQKFEESAERYQQKKAEESEGETAPQETQQQSVVRHVGRGR